MATQNGSAGQDMFVFFSRMLGVGIVDADRQPLGVLWDVLIEPFGKYAKAKALVVASGRWQKKFATIGWADVEGLAPGQGQVKARRAAVSFSATPEHKAELSLRQDILDQQVVDTNHQNVIRVNDIHLLFAEKDLVVAHVDIGLRGIFRRLGYEPWVDALVRLIRPNAAYLNKPHFISWKHIQPLSINPVSMTIKVDVSQKELRDIPAPDLSEIMLDLAPRHRLALFKTLDLAARTQLFMMLEFKEQKSLLEDLDEREAVDILNHLPTDEGVDFLGALPRPVAEKIMALMETKSANRLSSLLGYASESAGGLMTTEFIWVLETATIEEALRIVKERTLKAEAIQSIFIVDGQKRLVGSTSLRRLIIAEPGDNVMKAALKKTVSIRTEDDVKKIAFLMDKYKYVALPVVNTESVLVGIITIDDIFNRLVTIAWRRARRRKDIR